MSRYINPTAIPVSNVVPDPEFDIRLSGIEMSAQILNAGADAEVGDRVDRGGSVFGGEDLADELHTRVDRVALGGGQRGEPLIEERLERLAE